MLIYGCILKWHRQISQIYFIKNDNFQGKKSWYFCTAVPLLHHTQYSECVLCMNGLREQKKTTTNICSVTEHGMCLMFSIVTLFVCVRLRYNNEPKSNQTACIRIFITHEFFYFFFSSVLFTFFSFSPSISVCAIFFFFSWLSFSRFSFVRLSEWRWCVYV